MRFVFWNIRAGGGRRAAGIFDQLLAWQPDVIGLSEFRGTPASQQLAAQLANAGFAHQINTVNSERRATNALLLAGRQPLTPIQAPDMPSNPERWLLAQIAGARPLIVGLMHIPNYTHPQLKYPFLNSILQMVDGWDLGPAVLAGDTNCGKRGIDEEKPTTPAIFKREHDWLIDMESRQWPDAFRHLHGDRREYTWYSHRNNGFRLDYAFLHPDLAPQLTVADHRWGQNPQEPNRREGLSDHAALIVDIKV